jgi:transposase
MHLLDIKVMGVDPSKNVCSLAVLDKAGAGMFRMRVQFWMGRPPCIVAMSMAV